MSTEDKYQEGYDKGYIEGWDAGLSSGYDEGALQLLARVNRYIKTKKDTEGLTVEEVLFTNNLVKYLEKEIDCLLYDI